MNLCPTCKTSFSGGEQFCPRDGTPLRQSLPEDPLAGRVLSGRYRLIEVIGRGGMGAVYRAHHILMDKGVAVKVLRQELASDTEAVARFHREARSASRLDHENIIRVSDFGQTDDGLLFLVMELLDGENLAQLLRRGVLPWRRAVSIVRDVAVGLAHAHEQGVIHRDLKPENILIVRRGKSRQGVKVLDFGLAKLVQLQPAGNGGADASADEQAEPDVAIQSLTRSGVVFGTPEYMSPEQAEGRSLDARTDIYALGVVSYQILSGKLPFSAPTFLALIAKTVNDPPPPLRQNLATEAERQALPEAVEELVLRCLSKSPDERPQSAEEIAETLTSILERFPEEYSKSGEQPVTPPQSGAHSTPPSAGIAGGVARTVPRHLPPGQTPRTAPRDSEPHPAATATPTSSRPPSREAPVEKVKEAPVEAERPSPPVVAEIAKVRPQSAESASARQEGPDGDGDVALSVPRRPYWLAAIAVLGMALFGAYFARGYWKTDKPVAPVSLEREPLRRARELLAQVPLAQSQIDEALRILRDERESYNTPEVHRLLSRAYEAQGNRLRALGHLYTAARLSPGGIEAARSQVALSQLLSRFGHNHDACLAAARALSEKLSSSTRNDSPAAPAADVRRQAESVMSTLRCPSRN